MVLGKQRHDMAALRRPPEVGEANLIVGRADVGSRVPEGQAGVPTGQGPDLTRAGRAGQRRARQKKRSSVELTVAWARNCVTWW